MKRPVAAVPPEAGAGPPPRPEAGRSRRPAAESEILARYAAVSPLAAESPYHAFAHCPPTALFGKPRLWPGPEASASTARLLWDDDALYACWELEGPAASPIRASDVDAEVLAELEGGRPRPEQRAVLLDERVECFLWQPSTGKSPRDGPCIGETYYAFDINYGGQVLTNRAQFGRVFDFEWVADGTCSVWTQEMAVGWGSSASPVAAGMSGVGQPYKRVVIAEIRWKGMGIDPCRELRVGLHRAQHPPGAAVAPLDRETAARLLDGMVWSSWVDPGDSAVDFHRPELFGTLVLGPRGSGAGCSYCAARLLGTKRLRVLPTPRPALDECPPGSLLVRAKYASLCGSDLPYFRNSNPGAPSCYWDRDGFCGHEVVGIVMESKSSKFQPGDPVMALPSSYFKAHVGSKQEWYRSSIHDVLLKDFPVRGGFSQVYTSHELYSYKLRECTQQALAAQGLGTVLRMARRLGPVLGKTVVVLGQGQNGLMATRLTAQMCAKHVIAVDPLEYRRALSLAMGATHAVAPADAASAVAGVTEGRGADVVMEVVGHNQDTINTAIELVACAGTVVAFGVPDDRYYKLDYSTLFRKNVTLLASVIPDPGVDFPEAVRLIEQGRFSTEGLFSHVIPLSELQRAFEVASQYLDGVVKLVVDLD